MIAIETWARRSSAAVIAALTIAGAASTALAGPPPIRITPDNRVPACATPDALMAFLRERNPRVERRYRDIAKWYRHHGEAWHVRWDYAFFQMAIETNFLSYRAPNGRMGDVDPRQNNFAGIGATGGGVPGDAYPDVNTGVLAQIQHLVAYSGERLAEPVAPRTRLKQDDIIVLSAQLGRPVTFADLARRWAADRHYGRSIEWVAGQFASRYCRNPDRAATSRYRDFPRPAGLGGPMPLATGARSTGVIQVADAGASPVHTIWTRDSGAPANTANDGWQPQETTTGTTSEVTPTAAPAGPSDRSEATAAAAGGTFTPDIANDNAYPEAAPPPGTSIAAAQNDKPEDLAANPMMRLGISPGLAAAWASRSLVAPRPATPAARLSDVAVGPVLAECRIISASYGGTTTMLIESKQGQQTRLTALTVLDGFEQSMVESYVKVHAVGGTPIGSFPSKGEAMAKARELCPNG